jgi:hypothetical protein
MKLGIIFHTITPNTLAYLQIEPATCSLLEHCQKVFMKHYHSIHHKTKHHYEFPRESISNADWHTKLDTHVSTGSPDSHKRYVNPSVADMTKTTKSIQAAYHQPECVIGDKHIPQPP